MTHNDLWVRSLDNNQTKTKALSMFGRKIARKIRGPVKERERWRIRTNKKIKGHVNRGRYCKAYRLPPTEMV
jgi:hypothetical protein